MKLIDSQPSYTFHILLHLPNISLNIRLSYKQFIISILNLFQTENLKMLKTIYKKYLPNLNVNIVINRVRGTMNE